MRTRETITVSLFLSPNSGDVDAKILPSHFPKQGQTNFPHFPHIKMLLNCNVVKKSKVLLMFEYDSRHFERIIKYGILWQIPQKDAYD